MLLKGGCVYSNFLTPIRITTANSLFERFHVSKIKVSGHPRKVEMSSWNVSLKRFKMI